MPARRGFYHPTVIIILALITLSFAIIFYINSKYFTSKPSLNPTPVASPRTSPSPSPQPSSKADSTANWKTYASSQLGIPVSFQYPSNWMKAEEAGFSGKPSNEGAIDLYDYRPTGLAFLKEAQSDPEKQKQATETLDFSIQAENILNTDGSTSTAKNEYDLFKEIEKDKSLQVDYLNFKALEFLGYKAYRYNRNYNNQGYTDTLTFEAKNRIWIISISSRSKDHILKNTKNFDQILSTFKFL